MGRSGPLFIGPRAPLRHQPLARRLSHLPYQILHHSTKKLRNAWSTVITAPPSQRLIAGMCVYVCPKGGLGSWESRMNISAYRFEHMSEWERQRKRERETDHNAVKLPEQPNTPVPPRPRPTPTKSLSHLEVFFLSPFSLSLSPCPFISAWVSEFKIIRSGFWADKCIQTCYLYYHRSSRPHNPFLSLSLPLLTLSTVQWHTILHVIFFMKGGVWCILSSFCIAGLFEALSGSERCA